MKTFLRFNVFQLFLITAIGLFFQNSYGQVAIATHNTNVTTALTGWNGTLPNGFAATTSGNYVGTSAATTGGLYAIANAGFGFQASGSVTSVDLTGTYRNTTGSVINSLQISYQAFVIVARDSRKPNWTVTSSLGTVTGLNWTYNASNTVANPVTKTITLTNLSIANNATFTLSFASDRGTGTSSSSMIGLKNIIIRSVVPTISANPATMTFADTETGTNSTAQTASITTTLATAAVTATAPEKFQVSSDGTSWGSTATLATSGGTLHVRFSPTEIGLVSGNVTLTTAGAADRLIAVSGTGTGASLSIATDTATFGPFCNSEATALSVNFTAAGTFTDTLFSVQLSNADGTFPATATNIIGTGTTSPISATLPANVTAGTNYRIRVLNANPLTFSIDNGSDIIINASSAGGTISGSATFCGTTNSGTLTLADNIGTVTKWQSSTLLDFSTATDIANTTSTLDFSNLYVTTYFRAVVANQTCASDNSSVATITITPIVTPNFAQIPAFCSGSAAPVLALTSPNGIAGTWNPATVSNTIAGTYAFTPDAGQCALPLTLTTTITTPVVPDFAQIPAFCSGSAVPVLALTSPNGIAGTWNPATVSNTIAGTYAFTPDAGQCALPLTLTTTITTPVVPDFAQIPAFCSGSAVPVLALTSPNGITGIWNPATVSNTAEGSYVFTPDAGQCALPLTLTTTITTPVVPDFAQIPAFCSGSAVPVLALISPNGITGTWNPATVSNTAEGSYVFTPDAGQCALPLTLTTTITTPVVPDFAQIPAFCSGSAAPVLALTSPNGIAGTWNPATVSNTAEGSYVFTPDAGQCALPLTLTTTITTPVVPEFAQIPAFCSGSAAPVLALTSPNGIIGTWNPATVSNTIAGSYTFTPDAGQCASIVTLTTIVTTTLPPTGNATQDFTTGQTLSNFSVIGANIKWYDAPTGGNELPNTTLIVSGTVYYVSQTVNGCESSSRLPITAGIDLDTVAFETAKLKYYPNPVDQVLNLEYNQVISSLAVYNLLGQQILVSNPNNTAAKIDLSNLSSGTYIIKIASENNSKTIKVIKR